MLSSSRYMEYLLYVLPFECKLDLNKLNFVSCILNNSLTSTFILKNNA